MYKEWVTFTLIFCCFICTAA